MTHHLRAEGLTQAEVLQALREHGVEDLVGSKPPCWKSTAQSALLRWLTLVIRQVPADDLGGRDAVQFGHEQVHQHDVGSKPMRHAHRLGGTRTLAPFRASAARRVTVLVDRTTPASARARWVRRLRNEPPYPQPGCSAPRTRRPTRSPADRPHMRHRRWATAHSSAMARPALVTSSITVSLAAREARCHPACAYPTIGLWTEPSWFTTREEALTATQRWGSLPCGATLMAPEDSMLVVNELARHWWVIGLRGLVAVLFGILAFAWPGMTLTVLIVLFGAYALVDGVLGIVAALRGGADHRWAMLIEGVISVLAGIAAFVWPGLTALVLLYIHRLLGDRHRCAGDRRRLASAARHRQRVGAHHWRSVVGALWRGADRVTWRRRAGGSLVDRRLRSHIRHHAAGASLAFANPRATATRNRAHQSPGNSLTVPRGSGLEPPARWREWTFAGLLLHAGQAWQADNRARRELEDRVRRPSSSGCVLAEHQSIAHRQLPAHL